MACVKSPAGGWKIGGVILGISHDVSFALAVHGDGKTLVITGAAEECGVYQRPRAVGFQYRHKGV